MTIRAFVRRLFACRHRATVRERRPLDDANAVSPIVMHFVCLRCGFAWPMVPRSPREHFAAELQRRRAADLKARREDRDA